LAASQEGLNSMKLVSCMLEFMLKYFFIQMAAAFCHEVYYNILHLFPFFKFADVFIFCNIVSEILIEVRLKKTLKHLHMVTKCVLY
jgi:hypothetical protein